MNRIVCAASLALALAAPVCAQGATPKRACAMVTRTDVEHVLGWHVDSAREKRYDVMGRTGAMCFLEAHDGVVTVTIPDPGSGFPGMTAFNTTDTQLVRTVPTAGATVALFNSTVYVSRHGIDVSVRAIGNDRVASYSDVEPFAKVVIARIK